MNILDRFRLDGKVAVVTGGTKGAWQGDGGGQRQPAQIG